MLISLMGSSSAVAATAIYTFDHYAAGFTGSLGTVTVSDSVANQLLIDINLTDNTFFQQDGGSGSENVALWFDLGGASVPLTYNFTAPTAGGFPTGGQFTGKQFDNNAFRGGGGFLSGFDYAVTVKDTAGDKDYYGGTNNLTFTITGTGLTLASLTSQSETNGLVSKNVFFGADLRQCIGTAVCPTGPVGATLSRGGGGGDAVVPEPGTWALMIIGFGGAGAMLRRRRAALA